MLKSHGVDLGVRCWLHSKKYKKPVLVWEDINDRHHNRIEIENIDGTDKQVFPMRSFTGNFLTRLLRSLNGYYPYYNAGSPAGFPAASHGKMRDGTTDFLSGLSGVCAIGGNYNTTGIQIGFDPAATPAVTQRDFNLAGTILGTTLSKAAMMSTELGMDSFGAVNSQYAIERIFTNNTGSDVTFNESGIFINYATVWGTNSPTASYIADNQTALVVRDVFAPITIPTGTGKRVRYIFKLSASGDIGFNNNFIKATGQSGLMGNISVTGGYTNIAGAIQAGAAWVITASSQNVSSPQGKGYATQQFSGLALSTGDAAFDLNKFTFTPINHGAASGQLYYNEDYSGAFGDDPVQGTKTVRNFFRRFDNFSGASITAKSLGWLTAGTYATIANRAMIAYSLINGGTGITIADDDSLTVEVIMSCDTAGV
jgi:hypothetical protein